MISSVILLVSKLLLNFFI